MPSFDIVSEINKVNLSHTVDNANRELASRFDFRGVESSIILDDLTVTLKSESDFQVNQLLDILRSNATRQNISLAGAEIDDKPTHSGKTFILTVRFKQGIEQPLAKQIVKIIKDSKIKVQAAIQGDKIRVNGKKRDDLQSCIALLKNSKIEQPLQYENFRD